MILRANVDDVPSEMLKTDYTELPASVSQVVYTAAAVAVDTLCLLRRWNRTKLFEAINLWRRQTDQGHTGQPRSDVGRIGTQRRGRL